MSDALLKKYAPILEHEEVEPIKDIQRKKVTAQLLENQLTAGNSAQEALTEDTAPTNVNANVAKYDPILISLVRRAMPNLVAYDVAGVQPMTGPTGLIFAMRPKYVKADGTLGMDAFYKEADTAHSGTGTHEGETPSVLNDDPAGTYSTGRGMSTETAELLGSNKGQAFAEMGFEVEKLSVVAKSRALKASYSVELAQDMKAIHNLDAEQELSNILASEILAEINREMVRTIYQVAKPGAQNGTTTAGVFDLDTDSNGRWSVEKFKGLMFQIEREANQVAKETRRGKGNFIICSSDIASALAMAGILDFAPAISSNLQVDDTGNTFAGILNGRYKVYIDPYATDDYYVVGYKGSSSYDAGIYYSPYIPLQLYKTVDDDTFQPKLGFKTRYGLTASPFAEGLDKGMGGLNPNSNVYFRRVRVSNIM